MEELRYQDWRKSFLQVSRSFSYPLGPQIQLENFSCKPIRHFKFPDFNTSPAFDQDAIPFRKNNIFPIGVHLDNEVIEAFLDIAVSNNYINQEFRDSITHYEIFRGDTKFDRSVIAKGLLYDMYQYPEYEFSTEDSNTDNNAWFSNFPYNDLSNNKLLYQDEDRTEYIPHPFRNSKDGAARKSNYKYTFHSPETSFDKLSDRIRKNNFQK